MQKPILVTGAGFIGRPLVRALLREGHAVCVADIETAEDPTVEVIDVRVPSDIERIFRCQPWAVFHLAGPVLGTARKDMFGSLNLQLAGTLNVARECQRAGAKLILASSFYVYDGIGADQEVDERTPLDVFLPEPFGAMKLMAERIVAAAGVPFVNLRFGSVYGAGPSSNAVQTFLETAEGGVIEVWGQGTRVNQYTYLDDIVDGCIMSLDSAWDGLTVNLISETRTSTRQLAEMAAARRGATVSYLVEKPEGASMATMRSSLAASLGWSARPIEAGIDAMEAECRKKSN